ncbi:hyalin-like [Ptychodera flava]|uniref:hyalin-like n=1 Tax=Ptychodera flava TaxID=63121 RepID=UPI00396A99FE
MARRRRRCRVLVVCIYVSWFLSACNSQAGKAGEVTRKCFSQNNTDRPGRDFYGMPIEKLTYEDCCTACLKNALCKALVYNEDNRRCWFKHDAPPPSPLANHISAILEDSQEPVIICPSDFETSTYIDMHTIELTWSLPSVSDNSGSVNLSVSHERGSNFSIGVTTVSYIAEDPFGNTAYCWFNVTVKEQNCVNDHDLDTEKMIPSET